MHASRATQPDAEDEHVFAPPSDGDDEDTTTSRHGSDSDNTTRAQQQQQQPSSSPSRDHAVDAGTTDTLPVQTQSVAATAAAAERSCKSQRRARKEVSLADFLVQVDELQRRDSALRAQQQQTQQQAQRIDAQRNMASSREGHNGRVISSRSSGSAVSRASFVTNDVMAAAKAASLRSTQGSHMNDEDDDASVGNAAQVAQQADATLQPLLPWHIALWRMLLSWTRYLAIAASFTPGVSLYEANRTGPKPRTYDDKDD